MYHEFAFLSPYVLPPTVSIAKNKLFPNFGCIKHLFFLMPIDSVDQGFITGTGWKPQPSDSFACTSELNMPTRSTAQGKRRETDLEMRLTGSTEWTHEVTCLSHHKSLICSLLPCHPTHPAPTQPVPMKWKAPNLVSLIITTTVRATSSQMLTLHYVLTFSPSAQVHKVCINSILHEGRLRLRKAN